MLASSPSIIRYQSSQSEDLFTASITMREFHKTTFPNLGNDEALPRSHFNFNQFNSMCLHKELYNGQGEKKVRHILWIYIEIVIDVRFFSKKKLSKIKSVFQLHVTRK